MRNLDLVDRARALRAEAYAEHDARRRALLIDASLFLIDLVIISNNNNAESENL